VSVAADGQAREAEEAETVKQESSAKKTRPDALRPDQRPTATGLAGWLLARLRGYRRDAPRLVVLERIALAPRQSLALVEAEGLRFLVATSPEGTPAFHALENMRVPVPARASNRFLNHNQTRNQARNRARREAATAKRVSW